MRAVLLRPRSGEVQVDDVPPPHLGPGRVLIRNEFSLISAGTERSRVEVGQQSLLGKARSRPDQVKRVLQSVRQVGLRETYGTVQDRLDAPVPMGYSCAGVVLEVGDGVDDVAPGYRVAAAGAGYANHAEVVSVPKNLVVPLTDGVSTRTAAFTTVGAIALQGIHQAEAPPGSRVAVIGLGLVGQLAIRLLKAYGYDVLGVDVDPAMLQMAAAAGVPAVQRAEGSLLDVLPGPWRLHGADAVVIAAATKSTDPIESAGEIARDRATVVVLGDVAVEPSRETYYGKELIIRYSRSYGPGRYDLAFEEGGIEYPPGYVPWTERRNMAEVVRLFGLGLLEIDTLQPVEYPVEQAPQAYDLLTKEGGERRVAMLLRYPAAVDHPPDSEGTLAGERTTTPVPARAGARTRAPAGQGVVRIGAVGAGSFPTRMLFPHLKRSRETEFAWLFTSGGLTARHQGSRWGFGHVVANLDEGLALGEADCVMVLSRHDSHAALAASVLGSGLALYVEKPVGLTEDELNDVASAWLETSVPAMAGFNRRFAPAVRDLKGEIGTRGPIQVVYRVFAGKLPSTHWYFDPAQGGRILGEVCHFVDTVGYLVGARPMSVRAWEADGHRDPVRAQSVTAVVDYADGSTASIVYSGATPPGAPKEMIEVSANGLAARIDDFASLRVWGSKRRTRRYHGRPKGHEQEMAELVRLVKGNPLGIGDFRLALWSSLVTVCLARSLSLDEAVPVGTRLPALQMALGLEPVPQLTGGH